MKVKVAQCYDDGVATDIRFIEILRKYNAKATFNLCPGFMRDNERVEPYRDAESGRFCGGRVALSELRDIYGDFEVASHCWKHENAGVVEDQVFIDSAVRARDFLEDVFQRPCRGFAYPCSAHTPSTEKLLEDAGFAYARTVASVEDVRKSPSMMIFEPNVHFMASKFMERFERAKATGMFYFWGHTYELSDDPQLWEEYERRIALISADPDVEWVNVIDLAEEVRKLRSTSVIG